MKISFRRQKNIFNLISQANDPFITLPEPDILFLDYEGRVPEKEVSKNAVVYKGMLLARHTDAGRGDLHCPVYGKVVEADTKWVVIEKAEPVLPESTEVENANQEGEGANSEIKPVVEVKPVDLEALRGPELVLALKSLGLDTLRLTAPCQTLIINGLNPEPGILFAESMLTVYVDIIRAGISIIQRISPAAIHVLAVADGIAPDIGGFDIKNVNPVYPNSLDPLVIRAVTGQENSDGVSCISLHELWNIGCVAKSGLPLSETVISLNGKNYIAKIGTQARGLLDIAGLEAKNGDTLVFGGPFRGVAKSSLDAGITASTYGLFLVTGDLSPEGEAACISCGECVQICPARIQPGLISRFAEAGMDDKCAKFHIKACLSCGLCSYSCLSRRPVLQYLRLATERMAKAE